MCLLTERAVYLEEQRQLYKTIFNQSTDGILLIEDNKFIECNDAIVNMLKYKDKTELLNTHPSQLSPEFQPCGKTSFEKANEQIQVAIKQGKNTFEWVHKKSDGQEFWVEVVLTDISTEDSEKVLVVWRDIDDKKKLEEKLVNLNNQLEQKTKELEASMDTIHENVIFSVVDLKGIIIDASKAFSDICGYEQKELIGQPHNIVRHPDTPSSLFEDLWKTIKQGKEWKGELKNLKRDGSYYWVETTITPKFDSSGNIYHYVSIRHDITARVDLRASCESLKESEEYFKNLSNSQMELANTDPLTGISNRRFFFDIATKLIKISSRTKTSLSILMIDIDFFKTINDTYGHLVGDDVLKYLTRHIENSLRESDIFARFGGEEFVVLLPETDLEEGLIVAEKIRLLFSENIYIENKVSIPFTVSIGVSQYKNEPLLEKVIQRADEALYKAKNNGRNKVESI